MADDQRDEEPEWQVPLSEMPRGLQLAVESARREMGVPARRVSWWRRVFGRRR